MKSHHSFSYFINDLLHTVFFQHLSGKLFFSSFQFMKCFSWYKFCDSTLHNFIVMYILILLFETIGFRNLNDLFEDIFTQV